MPGELLNRYLCTRSEQKGMETACQLTPSDCDTTVLVRLGDSYEVGLPVDDDADVGVRTDRDDVVFTRCARPHRAEQATECENC